MGRGARGIKINNREAGLATIAYNLTYEKVLTPTLTLIVPGCPTRWCAGIGLWAAPHGGALCRVLCSVTLIELTGFEVYVYMYAIERFNFMKV